MKFTPASFKENVNISQRNPLGEFFTLLGGILGVLLIIYFVLGIALDIVVEKIPDKIETRLGGFFDRAYRLKKTPTSLEQRIQKLLDELVEYIPDSSLKFTVHIIDEKEINAIALPGGNIVLTSGLVQEIDSQNELAMVLAHELGHFVHRDHLRGLGRGLVLMFISTVLFGSNSEVTDFLMNTLTASTLKYSRKQEALADNFALELVHKKYGHVGGATDFFGKMKGKEKLPRFFQFFLTHPFSEKRISLLESAIQKRDYEIGPVVPFDE